MPLAAGGVLPAHHVEAQALFGDRAHNHFDTSDILQTREMHERPRALVTSRGHLARNQKRTRGSLSFCAWHVMREAYEKWASIISYVCNHIGVQERSPSS